MFEASSTHRSKRSWRCRARTYNALEIKPNVPNPLALKKMKQRNITIRFSAVGVVNFARLMDEVGVTVGHGVNVRWSCTDSGTGVAVITTYGGSGVSSFAAALRRAASATGSMAECVV